MSKLYIPSKTAMASKTACHSPRKQSGVMLLEALIAILIFSLGILAIVGLQATSVKFSGDAKYRTDASLLTNQLFGQMWADDHTALVTNYNSPNGAKYITWAQSVTASLPVPAASAPTVSIGLINNRDSSGIIVETVNIITITIQWQAPSETQGHKYTAISQINQY
jgi:type IV pilus assembly protein PilV